MIYNGQPVKNCQKERKGNGMIREKNWGCISELLDLYLGRKIYTIKRILGYSLFVYLNDFLFSITINWKSDRKTQQILPVMNLIINVCLMYFVE